MPSRRHRGDSPVASGRHRRRASGGQRESSRSRGEQDKGPFGNHARAKGRPRPRQPSPPEKRRHRKERHRRSPEGRSRRRDARAASRQRDSDDYEAATSHRKRKKSGEGRRHKSRKRAKDKDKDDGSDEESVDEFGRSTRRRQPNVTDDHREEAEEPQESEEVPSLHAPGGRSSSEQPSIPFQQGAGDAKGSKSEGEGGWEEWRAQTQPSTQPGGVQEAIDSPTIDEFIFQAEAHAKASTLEVPSGKASSREATPAMQDVPPLKPSKEVPVLKKLKASRSAAERSTRPGAAKPLLPMLASRSQKEMAQLQWEDEDVLLKELCKIDKHVPEGHTWEKRGEGLLRILCHRKTGRARVIVQRMTELRILLNAHLELAKFKVQGKHYVCFLAIEKGAKSLAYFRARFRFTPQQESFAAVLQKLQDQRAASKGSAARS